MVLFMLKISIKTKKSQKKIKIFILNRFFKINNNKIIILKIWIITKSGLENFIPKSIINYYKKFIKISKKID